MSTIGKKIEMSHLAAFAPELASAISDQRAAQAKPLASAVTVDELAHLRLPAQASALAAQRREMLLQRLTSGPAATTFGAAHVTQASPMSAAAQSVVSALASRPWSTGPDYSRPAHLDLELDLGLAFRLHGAKSGPVAMTGAAGWRGIATAQGQSYAPAIHPHAVVSALGDGRLAVVYGDQLSFIDHDGTVHEGFSLPAEAVPKIGLQSDGSLFLSYAGFVEHRSADGQVLHAWDAEGLQSSALDLAVLRSGYTVVLGANELGLFMADGTPVTHVQTEGSNWRSVVALSGGGFATSGGSGVSVWSATGALVQHLTALPNTPVAQIAALPGGKWAAVRGEQVVIYDGKGAACGGVTIANGIAAMTGLPDGRLVTVDGAGLWQIWSF